LTLDACVMVKLQTVQTLGRYKLTIYYGKCISERIGIRPIGDNGKTVFPTLEVLIVDNLNLHSGTALLAGVSD